MKVALLSTAIVAASLTLTSHASAQTSISPPPTNSPPLALHHASTELEGAMRGTADMFRGIGDMNYNNSLALLHAQEAYSRYLDNRLKATATYFDMRKLNREARAEERGQRPTEESLARYAKSRAPERLAAFHFDAAHRRLIWPDVFYHPYFNAERETIDELMAIRGGAGPESRQVQALAGRMEEKLADLTRAGEVPGTVYGGAKRFITSLGFEMNFAPRTAGIAAR